MVIPKSCEMPMVFQTYIMSFFSTFQESKISELPISVKHRSNLSQPGPFIIKIRPILSRDMSYSVDERSGGSALVDIYY